MHLTIDIGNTALKFAIFDQSTILIKSTGMTELTLALNTYPLVSRAIISAVADKAEAVELLKNLNIPFEVLSHETLVPFQNLYKTPHTLGTDRIALTAAAQGMFGSMPVLTIAAGTCITYNFIAENRFYGGAISPGITMRFQALGYYTSALPALEWSAYRHEAYETLIGEDTDSSIYSGVLNGVVQEIDGTIEEFSRRYSGLKVVVTGGDMDFLVKNLKNDIFARPDMVLEGLNHILMHHA
jgi:type III pantothenate kinase